MHCWFLLKDVPRWVDFRKDVKETFNLKQHALIKQGACVEFEHVEPPPPMAYGGSSFKRPHGSRVTKEEQKQSKFQESTLRLHAQATIDMVASTLRKTTIMED